jgi:glutamate synthase (NADPH/NADH) small chain
MVSSTSRPWASRRSTGRSTKPWPYYPMRLRTSSSHEEGVDRHWGILTREFIGENGHIRQLVTVDITMTPRPDGPPLIEERPGTTRQWPADLVLIAIGYAGPQIDVLAERMGFTIAENGAIATVRPYATAVPGIFAAGDARRGQSLVVWAISEGREAAREVDVYLMGSSNLPAKGCCDLPLIR